MPTNYKISKWTIFWRFTVLWESESKRDKNGRVRKYLKVKCSCWAIKEIEKYTVTSWHTKSCWCLQKEICSKIWKKTGLINSKKAHLFNKWKFWKNNPNYKWKNSLSLNIRNSDEYKNWRAKCFERDNYTCQITWKKWIKLVVHHIKPFNIIISDLDIYNYRDYEILWNINNWITISEEIHKEFHKKYWTKKFTEKDFIFFKNNYYEQ